MTDFNNIQDIDGTIKTRLKRMSDICKEMLTATPLGMNELEAEHRVLCNECDALFAINERRFSELTSEPGLNKVKPLDKGFFGFPWEEGTMFGVTVLHHTWPMGWEKTVSSKFFSDPDILDKYLKDMEEWARSEDNEVRIDVYRNNENEVVSQHHFR